MLYFLRPVEGARAMNIEVRAREWTLQSKLDIVDCDFTPR
jgi:hypothetical protein